MVQELTKHVQHQEFQIYDLINRMEGVLDGEAIHATGNGFEVQHIRDLVKKTSFVNEMSISSEGVLSLGLLKKFIERIIKDKYKFSTKSSHMYVNLYTTRLITLKYLLVINFLNFNNLRVKEI